MEHHASTSRPSTFVGAPFGSGRPRSRTFVGYAVAEEHTAVEAVRKRPRRRCQERQDGLCLPAGALEALRAKLRAAEASEGGRPPATASDAPLVEVGLAPWSDSNFYAGFDAASPEGVFVSTYERPGVGSHARLEVTLPAGERLRVSAVVEWLRGVDAASEGLPAGVGYRMIGLDAAQRRLLRSFCRQRAPLFYVG